MLNMNKKLEQREKEGNIIKCGIVGAGQMGRGMVTQMVLMKGITPAVVSDIDLELAVHAFKYAGVKDADIVRTNDTADHYSAVWHPHCRCLPKHPLSAHCLMQLCRYLLIQNQT